MTTITKTLPLPFRLLNAVGGITRAKRLRRFRFEVDAVVAQAKKKTGLADFGHPAFLEGLGALLISAENDASLHFLGRLSLHSLIVDDLSNRLLLVEAQKRTPEVFETPLIPPIIVLGLLRSGTTHLHRLLAEDSKHYAPPYWQLKRPLPQPGKRDNRREVAVRELASLKQLAPELESKHFTTADTPEECNHLLGTGFESLIFWGMSPVHGYAKWYTEQDHSHKYESYRAWLQILQATTPGKRLALKAPEHTGALSALLAAVPEARFVQIHRDPVKTYASLNSLTGTVHAIMSKRPNFRRMAEANLQLLEHEATRNLAAREANPGMVHDVMYDNLMTDPVGTVGNIYENFGFDVSDAYQNRLTTYTNEHPKTEHGLHEYESGEFGVDDDQVRDRLKSYIDHFGL